MFALTVSRKSRRRSRNEAGSAALELGLLAPVLIIFVVAIAELGTGAFQAMRAQNAAEAGAIYASKNAFDASLIANAVVNSTGGATITATPAPSRICVCPTGAGLVATGPDSECADGSAPRTYVQINARVTHTPLMTFSSWAVPQTLTGRAFIRLDEPCE